MTAESADTRELARLRPPSDGLGIDAEQRGDFGWSEEVLRIRILARHCASYRRTERDFAAIV